MPSNPALRPTAKLTIAARAAVALPAAALLGGVVGSASAADPTQQELLDQVRALQAKVDQLQARQQAAEAANADATASTVRDDARKHDAVLDLTGVTGHYADGRFVLRSNDGNFLFHPWLQLQFRDTSTYRQDAKTGGGDDTQNGFEVRRLKFGLDGFALSPDLTYAFQFAVDRKTGNTALELAWTKYRLPDSPFYVRAGQFKDPLDHEQLAATRTLPAAERSLVDDVFANAEGFVQGVSLIYDPGKSLRAEAAFTDGYGSANTNFQDFPTPGIPADWGAAGRVEYKLFGNWGDYDVVSAYNAKGPTLVVGAGADYTEAGRTDKFTHVVDAQFTDRSGVSLYGAYLGRYTSNLAPTKTTAGGDTYDATLRAQATYSIDRHWEPYVRYEYIHFDGSEFAAGAKTTVHLITAGTNYYFAGPSARFTLDVLYLPNGSPVADDGAGILANSHNELVVRGQFQLVL